MNPMIGRQNNPVDSEAFAGLDKAQEAADKLLVIKKCYSKVYPPDLVHDILKACADKYAMALDPAVLDFDVIAATKFSKFFETLRRINLQSVAFHSPKHCTRRRLNKKYCRG